MIGRAFRSLPITTLRPALAVVLSTAAIAAGRNPGGQTATDEGERVSRRTEVFPNAPSIPSTVKVVKGVVYGSSGGRDLHPDVITRKKAPQAPRPAIVFIHGGSSKFGGTGQFWRQAA